MSAVATPLSSRLLAWFWYLLPANPILVRVVYAMSRRTRHLWLRFGYLAVLFAVVMVMLLTRSSSGSGSLADLAKGASVTFMVASITQLALMCFLAPVFTAGAITQERDSQTFNILLSTPLSNAQIVIGSLLSRLYFVIVLLLAGLPIFFSTMIYGGVTTDQIVMSFSIAGSTAVLTGSLAIAISMIRVGTRRTIFSFFFAIALYLAAVYAVGTYATQFRIAEAPANPVTGEQLSWLAAFHPFMALDVTLNRVVAPDIAAVAEYGVLKQYLAAYPQTMYIAMTLTLSVCLIVLSMLFVRRGAKEGESSLLSRLGNLFRSGKSGDRTRKPHQVWGNPIAWREAVTRASAMSRGIGRYGVMAGGFIGFAVLMYLYLKQGTVYTAGVTRQWVAILVAIEFAIVLLIAVNTAASSLTKDKETKTLDITLTTPISSRYLIWGKLRGLVSSVIPLILVPIVSLLVFAIVDLFRAPPESAIHIETSIEVGASLIVFSAYACMLGLHFSLKQRKTVRAVLIAVAVLLVANAALFSFWIAIVGSSGTLGSALAPATPFTMILGLIDPVPMLESPNEYASKIGAIRLNALIGTAVFVALHSVVVYSWYLSMVRSFDQIIRKQSGQ